MDHVPRGPKSTSKKPPTAKETNDLLLQKLDVVLQKLGVVHQWLGKKPTKESEGHQASFSNWGSTRELLHKLGELDKLLDQWPGKYPKQGNEVKEEAERDICKKTQDELIWPAKQCIEVEKEGKGYIFKKIQDESIWPAKSMSRRPRQYQIGAVRENRGLDSQGKYPKQGNEVEEEAERDICKKTQDETNLPAKSTTTPPQQYQIGAVRENRGLDSQGKNPKQGNEVEEEVEGDICKKIQDEVQDLMVPSSEIESLLKGILFIFGEGYGFEKDMLIHLWMAEGLIQNEPMEVVGAEYFEKLVTEGYILRSNENTLCKANIGKLDAELEIIQKSNCLRFEGTNQNNAASAEILHVSLIGGEIDGKIFKTLATFNMLRTLLFLGNYGSRLQKVPRELFMCLQLLQALDLSGTHISEFPSSAEKMIDLRYLDLSRTFIELLPKRISRFEKLQTLKVKGCPRLKRLPEEMKRLSELRHLDIDVLGQLVVFPKGIGALVKLRTLSAFPVGTEEGSKISELKCLDNLTGAFCISDLEYVQSADEAKEASLMVKRNIKKLELRWSDEYCEEPKTGYESVLENLRPCSDLEALKIVNYQGTKLPEWIAEVSFHMLVSIILFKCENVSVLPALEKLPSLQSLELYGLNSVTNMDFGGKVGQVAFPELKKLAVDEMLNLETWEVAQEGDFPSLVELIIKDCPKLPEPPSFMYLLSIKYLQVNGCTKLAFLSEKNLPSSLRKLVVEDCPLIEERCSELGGQDWHKIQHIPKIWIHDIAIQSREDDSENGTEGNE